jgi:hypothetical protein
MPQVVTPDALVWFSPDCDQSALDHAIGVRGGRVVVGCGSACGLRARPRRAQEQAEQIPSPEPRIETPARVIAPSSRLTGSQTKFRAYGLAWLAAGAWRAAVESSRSAGPHHVTRWGERGLGRHLLDLVALPPPAGHIERSAGQARHPCRLRSGRGPIAELLRRDRRPESFEEVTPCANCWDR